MLLPTRGDDTRGRAARRVEDVADRARAAWRGEVGKQGGSRMSRTPGARAAGRGKVRGVMAALMVEDRGVVAALITEVLFNSRGVSSLGYVKS